LDVLGAGAQVRMAGVDLAPRVDDPDHRPAGPVLGVVADLAQPRAVAERAQVADPEPAMAAQLIRTFAWRHYRLAPLVDAGAGEFDDLAPFLGLAGDDIAEIGGRAGHRRAAELGEPRLDVAIGQRVLDRLVEHRDDLGRRLLGRAHPEPGAGLVT